ncbi:MAG: cupin domain-containing protein [Actinomycetota bacterium]
MPAVRRPIVAVSLLALLALVGPGVPGAGAQTTSPTTSPASRSVARTTTTTGGAPTTATTAAPPPGLRVQSFGSTDPINAPGQRLSMVRVTAKPGAEVPTHVHPGVVMMRVEEGAAVFTVEAGDMLVIDRKGRSRTESAPTEFTIRAGETLVGLPLTVHRAVNRGTRRFVGTQAILVGDALANSLPPDGVLRPPITLTTEIASVGTILADALPNLRYGWNHLVGTATLDGQPVLCDMLGNVSYESGRGPFFGFVTFTWPDGSAIVTEMYGRAIPQSDGGSIVEALLTVSGGTGRYAAAGGYGTFVGRRDAAVGAPVRSLFTLVPTPTR